MSVDESRSHVSTPLDKDTHVTLGSLATEVAAYALVFLTLGVALFAFAVMHKSSDVIAATIGGSVVLGGMGFGQWWPRLRRAVSQALPVADDQNVERRRHTFARAVLWLALPSILVTFSTGLVLPSYGDGLIAGIWLGSGLLFLAGYLWARQWEASMQSALVREQTWWWLSSYRPSTEQGDSRQAWRLFLNIQ